MVYFHVFLSLALTFKASCSNSTAKKPDPVEVMEILTRVNDYWQKQHPEPGWSFWEHAAYHTGNLEAYAVTGHVSYLNYSIK
jgi:unsaturated rhamnogalacturonyl hydrolase